MIADLDRLFDVGLGILLLVLKGLLAKFLEGHVGTELPLCLIFNAQLNRVAYRQRAYCVLPLFVAFDLVVVHIEDVEWLLGCLLHLPLLVFLLLRFFIITAFLLFLLWQFLMLDAGVLVFVGSQMDIRHRYQHLNILAMRFLVGSKLLHDLLHFLLVLLLLLRSQLRSCLLTHVI